MPRQSRRTVRLLVAVSLVSAVFVAQGCTPTAAGGGVDKRAAKKARIAEKRGGGNKRAANAAAKFSSGFAAGAGKATVAGAAFKKSYGYIVKGTDFLTYWPCDSVGYFYLSAPASINVKISQQYKFSATRPYVPMYAELRVRYVADSLTRGERVFSRYVEVADYVPGSRDDAKCKGPSRATMSSEMQRLDQFKVERPTR
ncbi:MAG: hypothetical protein IT360_13320 [Gemmatimonadaceae bacterium]|nr:hypothetical protein [Gemmatimonadaceae bacterium]